MTSAAPPREPDRLDLAAPVAEGGCASKDTMRAAAADAGKRDILDHYAADYPVDARAGPHDQPQSMCPAFGSLRVGLRMRRTATILSGSACCVYGLTFTSHFYGARRSVGYVPFSSETLVTGKLFEVEGGKLSIADGWRRGPEQDKGARWQPAEVGAAVDALIEQAVPAQKVYGT